MKDTQGYITLEDVVKEYLFQAEDSSNNFMRCLPLAINAMNDIRYDYGGYLQSKPVLVQNGILLYPEDYVNYVQLSVCIKGNKVSLGLNPQMCQPGVNNCGETLAITGGNLDPYALTSDQNQPEGSGWLWGYEYLEEGSLPQFGFGAGYSSHGYYKEDRPNRRFLVSERFTGQYIILDYVSSAYTPNTTIKHLVHVFSKPFIKSYMAWQERLYVTGKQNEALYYKQECMRERVLLIRRMRGLRLREVIDSVKHGYTQAPKG